MKTVVFDCEADGLSPTKIHCIVCYEVETEEWKEFTPENLWEFITYSQTVDKWVGHNAIDYDVYHINRLLGTKIPYKNVIDTLVLSQMYDPDLKHGLKEWGLRFGIDKPEHDDWETYSPEMLYRCKEDCKINVKLYKKLLEWTKNFSKFSIDTEMKVREIICQQQRNGFPFDLQKATMILAELQEKLEEAEATVRKTMKPMADLIRVVEPKYKQNGELSKIGLKAFGDNYQQVVGPFSLIIFEPFNVGSHLQIGKQLMRKGWQPTEFTEKTGQPKVDEDTLEGVDIPEAKIIHRYLMLQKRCSMLRNWIENYNHDTGRIHGRVNVVGAVTHRMSHFKPNIAQTASKKKEYGALLRSCFVYSPPYLLAGTDASGLELRCFAHTLGDQEYIRQLLESDIHLVHLELLEFPKGGRDTAKTFIYAYLYGAGVRKLAKILGYSQAKTRRIIDSFLEKFPKLQALKNEFSKAKSYIKSYDGRWLKSRSAHSALNTYLQNLGAVICKVWLIRIMHHVANTNLDVHLVASIHDEYQFLCHYKAAREFKKICKLAIKETEKILKISCPLDCGVSFGKNWSQTH